MIERRSVLVAVAMIAFLAPGFSSMAQDSAAEKTQESDTPQAKLPKPLVIPPEEKRRQNPVPKSEEAIEAGRTLFTTQCSMCHDDQGKGRGDLAVSLKMKVPDLSDPKLQKKRTDGDLFYIITQGHGQMPGETRLPERNRWEMIHFIRALKAG